MTTKEIYFPGERIKVQLTAGSAFAGGEPYVLGFIPMVALNAGDASNYVTVATTGVFDLPVQAMSGSNATAVAVGDKLYFCNNASTPSTGCLTRTSSSGSFFGYALEALTTAAGSAAPVDRMVKVGY